MNNNFNQQPQQPMYQQPQQQPQAPKGSFNTKALLGLIFGGIGFLSFCLSSVPGIGLVGFIISILGLIFGIMGMGHAKATGAGKGLAIAGLIVGIVGIFFGFIGGICGICSICYCIEYSSAVSYYSGW